MINQVKPLKSTDPLPTLAMTYLFDRLRESLPDHDEVRLKRVQRAGTRRAADLPQDYDEESNDLHLKVGVEVRVFGREFFFPWQWVDQGKFKEIEREVERVLSYFESRTS